MRRYKPYQESAARSGRSTLWSAATISLLPLPLLKERQMNSPVPIPLAGSGFGNSLVGRQRHQDIRKSTPGKWKTQGLQVFLFLMCC